MLEMPMNTEKPGHEEAHPMGEGATDPIEPSALPVLANTKAPDLGSVANSCAR